MQFGRIQWLLVEGAWAGTDVVYNTGSSDRKLSTGEGENVDLPVSDPESVKTESLRLTDTCSEKLKRRNVRVMLIISLANASTWAHNLMAA
jgi:hypothetical protein